MPYVGNTPALNYTSFAVQHFTTSATTGYTLDHAVTNENDIRLVINNVVQQPGGSYAYTAAGTVLTLSAATAGTDTMYCVFLGKAVQTVTPPEGSVSESKLQVSNSPTNGYVLSAQSGAAGGLTWAADAAGTVTGYTNGVDNRVITSSGTTTLNGEASMTYDGTTLALTTSGGGLKLDGLASSNVNTLDDYEEGTWTPVYTSTGATITSGSTTGGAYVKIGKLVTVQGSTCTGGSMSGGTAGNSVGISGLPFANSDDTAGENMRPTGTFDGWLSTYTWGGDIPSVMQVTNNASSMYLAYRDAVDGYASTTRFDDLADTSGNPRNLAYFQISYIAAT